MLMRKLAAKPQLRRRKPEGRGRFPAHEEDRLCLPLGSVGSLVRRCPPWTTGRPQNKQTNNKKMPLQAAQRRVPCNEERRDMYRCPACIASCIRPQESPRGVASLWASFLPQAVLCWLCMLCCVLSCALLCCPLCACACPSMKETDIRSRARVEILINTKSRARDQYYCQTSRSGVSNQRPNKSPSASWCRFCHPFSTTGQANRNSN